MVDSIMAIDPSCSSFRGARSASPESITTIVSMDSGPAPSAHPGMTMVGSMPDPKNLPRLGGAGDLAPGAAGAGGDGFDQLAVRGHLLAVGKIERIFQPGAQVTAEIGAALVQRPDFGAADRSDLPARVGQ